MWLAELLTLPSPLIHIRFLWHAEPFPARSAHFTISNIWLLFSMQLQHEQQQPNRTEAVEKDKRTDCCDGTTALLSAAQISV
ncbi:hypothetical protein EYF80_021092 [Liparis tanakae]|uniref:Uncharacterized protein n=1 Tax=Liparis tanakae TaxID=230148 RepID=A0A4Z2HUP5_9TELE|nr:hypothetical protein EYF80_021092 [Liparis tanakae]